MSTSAEVLIYCEVLGAARTKAHHHLANGMIELQAARQALHVQYLDVGLENVPVDICANIVRVEADLHIRSDATENLLWVSRHPPDNLRRAQRCFQDAVRDFVEVAKIQEHLHTLCSR